MRVDKVVFVFSVLCLLIGAVPGYAVTVLTLSVQQIPDPNKPGAPIFVVRCTVAEGN